MPESRPPKGNLKYEKTAIYIYVYNASSSKDLHRQEKGCEMIDWAFGGQKLLIYV
jgi:hypothetical protein